MKRKEGKRGGLRGTEREEDAGKVEKRKRGKEKEEIKGRFVGLDDKNKCWK